MRKQEYLKLSRSVSEIMNSHGATQDRCGAYYIETPCGQLRVSVQPFVPRRKYVWLFTRIEKPELVHPDISIAPDFNKFSGKFNMFSHDTNYLTKWLSWYIGELLNKNVSRET